MFQPTMTISGRWLTKERVVVNLFIYLCPYSYMVTIDLSICRELHMCCYNV